jgi:hypothetical protein
MDTGFAWQHTLLDQFFTHDHADEQMYTTQSSDASSRHGAEAAEKAG